MGGGVGVEVEIIRIKTILVQSIEIGLTGTELGKIKVKEIRIVYHYFVLPIKKTSVTILTKGT